MNTYKVSVIVPLYNGEAYISQTLNSIIDQDFDDFEIIIVNDGSTDNSLKIAENTLKDSKRPYKIINQKNQGVSSARNKGIDNASGDYLIFVDADDYITPNHISNLYNPKYDFSLTQFVKKYDEIESKPYNYTSEVLTTTEFIKKELLMEIPFHFAQIIYKTSIIKDNNIQFPKGKVYGEDTYFALKSLIFSDKISINNTITYYYIQHPESAIKTTQFRRFEVVGLFEDLKKFYEANSKKELGKLIETSRIPKAIFGNMNFFFFNNYDFNTVINHMKKHNLFNKLSKYDGDFKFKLKIRLFLMSPKIYYKVWMKFKKSID